MSYAEQLVSRAGQLGLSERPEWQRLGHYRKGLFGGVESEVDGEPFFLDPEGKENPKRELEATLRGFFGPAPKDPAEQHALCRFPARLIWLTRELGIDPAKLPPRACTRYDEFVTRLQARSLTLVFSAYYLNNPASAFGHTFLRVNKAPRARDVPSDELLDYGIDFAAVVDTTNAVLYAAKGLTGLFPGTFNKVPFYFKVREYNDYESRDLWEYELNLSPEQVRLVTAHLWELGSTYFAYYYLSENCSYQIVAALEVADPHLELLTATGWPVIPADTVKALYKNPGLVRSVHFRPSNRTQLSRRLGELSSDEVVAVSALLSDPRVSLSPSLTRARTVKVLDTALDLASLRMARDLTKQRKEMDAAGLELEQSLLERRAAYAIPSEEPHFAPPFRQMPQLGHDSSRLGLGSGYQKGDGYYHTASFRLALHDLADPARGYPDGAEIEFLPGKLRYYLESPRVTLEELSLIRVRSLTPLTRFEHAVSWSVATGTKRLYDSGCGHCFAGFGEFGAGFALEPFGRALTLFALAKAELDLPAKDYLLSFFRVGVGPWGGARLRLSDGVTGLVTASWLYLPGQTPHEAWGLDGIWRIQYAKNFAFGAEGHWYPNTASLEALSYLYF